MKTAPQNDRVIAYILAYGSITADDADRQFGCKRLASRICDLKRKGYSIGKVMELGKNRYGEDVRYARYFLIKD